MKRSSVRLISLSVMLAIGILVLTRAALAKCHTYTTLDDPNGVGLTFAAGINNNGDIAGRYLDGLYCPPCNGYFCPAFCMPMNHGFLYNGSSYTTLDDPDGVNGTVAGINDNGDIVGFFDDSGGVEHGFLYSGGVYTTLDDPNGVGGTVASGINNNDVIVGSYWDSSNHEHGFLYRGGVYTTLDDPNGFTVASGINDTGDVVGFYFDSSSSEHGFLYNGSSYTTLDDPNGAGHTFVSGINNNGDIVGCYWDSSNLQHGFLYDGSSYTTLDYPNAVSGTVAGGINDNGDIVGYYWGSGEHGFLATPVPLWQDATAAGDGWYHLSPFGFFYPTPSTWIYHQTLGWLYPVGTSTDSIWFYDPQWDGTGGWWWTSSSDFPWVYSVTENKWAYYDATASSPYAMQRWFYDSGTGRWATH